MIDASPRTTKGRSAVTDADPQSSPASEASPGEAEHSDPGSADGMKAALFGVALLRLAVELKKADSRSFDELVASVLQRMRLPEDEFRAFLRANGGLLKSLGARKRTP